MKIATLVIIRRAINGRPHVLLGLRKTGAIGIELFNAPGGKSKDSEDPPQCAVRETYEEVRLKLSPKYLEEVAVITFYAGGVADFEVHVFNTWIYRGTPEETDDMSPFWFDENKLPYANMFESDRMWFDRAIAGEKFRANVFYKGRATDFQHIDFLPYEIPPPLSSYERAVEGDEE